MKLSKKMSQNPNNPSQTSKGQDERPAYPENKPSMTGNPSGHGRSNAPPKK